jgi:oxygen-independent coproporphyrinogen-3 oxidase
MVLGELGGGSETLETTIEVNPDDVTEVRIQGWVDAGVNRVSVGVQAFDNQVLEWMHRTHDAQQAARAIELLQRADMLSISVDVIFALPPVVGGDPVGDLRRVLQLGVPHVSAYGLTVEGGTALGRWVDRGRVVPVEPELYADEFLAIDALAVGAGYEHYEVSNYARSGHRSRHNSAYWAGESYRGLGPSAHSYDAGRRWWNCREWAAYDRCLRERQDPVVEEEVLTRDQRRIEEAYLGLRTSRGLPRSDHLCRPAVDRAVEAGWLELAGDVIRATPEGWLRLDELVTALTT